MCARKFGSDSLGDWQRDENSLPCYDLDLARVPRFCPPLRHVFGTGRVSMLADHLGVLQMFAATVKQPVCLNAPLGRPVSILSLSCGSRGNETPFLPHAMTAEQQPLMRWGTGYVRYEGELPVGHGKSLFITFRISAPVDESFFIARIGLKNSTNEDLPVELILRASISPAPAVGIESRRHAFMKDATAAFPDLHPLLGDFFLASEPADELEVGAGDAHLELRKKTVLRAGKLREMTALLGCSAEFSVDWVKAKCEEHRGQALSSAWAEWLNQGKMRAPELWMQEECVWNSGRLLAFRCASGSGLGKPVIVQPGGESAFLPGVRPEREAPPVSVRELLALSLPLAQRTPELALANLTFCCQAQARNGRLAESIGTPLKETVDAARDRSDLEVWLLLAWTDFITSHPDCDALDRTCPFLDGNPETVWEHLKRAYYWIRDELREGPHGLLRMLAGDSNPYLNKVGAEGKGESVLNSAMACYAAQRFVDIARRREELTFADEINAWLQKLRLAIGESFDEFYFRRAYTDHGRPLGGRATERIFADVQAWAVLAKCGTADQREQALTHLLKARGSNPACTSLCKPFPMPPPADVSDMHVPPGEGQNGGFCLPTAAWVTWALAGEGFTEEAFHEWQHLSIRYRAEGSEDLSAAVLMNLASVPSSGAGRRVGACGLRETFEAAVWLPRADAVAWQEFALRKITS